MADEQQLQADEDHILHEIEALGGGGPQAIADNYKGQLTVRLAREIRRLRESTVEASASADRYARAILALTVVLVVLTVVLMVRALQGH